MEYYLKILSLDSLTVHRYFQKHYLTFSLQFHFKIIAIIVFLWEKRIIIAIIKNY